METHQLTIEDKINSTNIELKGTCNVVDHWYTTLLHNNRIAKKKKREKGKREEQQIDVPKSLRMERKVTPRYSPKPLIVKDLPAQEGNREGRVLEKMN